MQISPALYRISLWGRWLKGTSSALYIDDRYHCQTRAKTQFVTDVIFLLMNETTIVLERIFLRMLFLTSPRCLVKICYGKLGAKELVSKGSQGSFPGFF